MREIKFRAWDKEEGKFTKYTDIMVSGETGELYFMEFDHETDNGGNLINVSNRYEIQQYTGLKDKNGKEIYEGDIVSVLAKYGGFELAKGTISWHDDLAGFGIHFEYEHSPVGAVNQGVEVIGNRFEHPHLLEGNHDSK